MNRFEVGDAVRIVEGAHKGFRGMVVDQDWVFEYADGTIEDGLIAVDVPMDDGVKQLSLPVDWLRLAEERAKC